MKEKDKICLEIRNRTRMTNILQVSRAEGGGHQGWEKIPRIEDPTARRFAENYRAEGPWAIFGEPERPKSGGRANGAKLSQLITQQKIQPRMINSAQIKKFNRK